MKRKTGQDRARQGKTGQDRARQGKTGQDKARQGKTGQDRGKTVQDRTRHTRGDELEAFESIASVGVECDGDEVIVGYEVHPGGRKLVTAKPGERRTELGREKKVKKKERKTVVKR